MVHLDLTDEETTVLRSALESYLSDMRYEIADTDRMDYRNGLKERKAVLRKVADALTDDSQHE